MKSLLFFLSLIYALLALPGALMALGYLWLAAAGWSRLVAVGGLAALLLPLAIILRFVQPSRVPLWSAASLLLGLAAGAVFLFVFITAPSGEPGSGSPVQQRFTGGGRFPRHSLGNLIPEIEQVKLGFLVAPFLDRFFTFQRAARVSRFTLNIYREMDGDADFRALGSSMGLAYADLLGRPFNPGHYYLYIPQNRPTGALPAIVFLHGAYGNFKAYTWVWSKLAEDLGFVIIAPSFGFGDWRRPGGVESVEKAIEDAGTMIELDEERVYLAGLSNGGLGISRLAAAAPERYRGLIFLSPVMPPELVDQPAFQEAWAGRPVLVLAGMADERIPLSYVEERAARLRSGGVKVQFIPYPGEDHFLFFSQREQILEDIARWLADSSSLP